VTVHDLDQRLRMLAEEGARLASAPGIEAALRRGRQRRRHLVAACAAVLSVAMVGGGFGLRSWLDPATDRIAAPPATTIPEDTQRGLEVRKVSRPAADTITIEGTMDGVAWRYTLDREQSRGQQVWADSIHFQNGGGGKAVGLFLSFPRSFTQDTLNADGLEFILGPVRDRRVPVYLQVENASTVDQQWDRLLTAKVTKQAAVLRVTLQRGSEGLPPVDVRPIPGGAGIPWNLAVFKLPAGTAAKELALLDSRGRLIASATS
jgi:hypothetical protein